MRKRKQGKVILNGVSPEKHEMDIIVVFTEAGYDVELIPPARFRDKKTADAVINDIEWEFKTPRGTSTRSIDHILRKATGQSYNIIIDIRQLKIPESIAVNRVRFAASRIKSIKRLKLITTSSNIIDIE